jgi:hypothetical protein
VHGNTTGAVKLNDIILHDSSGIPTDISGNVIKDAVDEHIFWLPTTMPKYGFDDDPSIVWGRRFSDSIIEERLSFLKYTASQIDQISKRDGHVVKLDDDRQYIDLTHPFGWYAFGHLHDSLQRLHSIKDLLESRNDMPIKFIISNPRAIQGFHDHLNALAGYNIPTDDILIARMGYSYRIKNYIKPNIQSVYTNFTSEIFTWLYNKYLYYFPRKDISKTRLYLTRNHISPGKRGVINEARVVEELSSLGFTIVYGNEPLAQIHSMFSRAEIVMGAHGSLFANTIFCPPDCRVIEYCAHNRLDYSFRNKKKLVKSYEHNAIEADTNFNIEIPVGHAMAQLRK